MADRDESAAQEVVRLVGRVLPVAWQAAGWPAWLLRFALPVAAVAGVVLFVVGKRLLPHLADELWEALKRAKVEPQRVVDEGGEQPQGTQLETAPENGGAGSPGG